MMKYFNKYLKVILAISCLGTLSFIAWGTIYRGAAKQVDVKPKEVDSVNFIPEYDPEILERFSKVCAKIAPAGEDYFISGELSSLNGADSAANVLNAAYVLNKKGQDLYCKLGNSETINRSDKYLYIDHSLKKIIISASKKINSSPGLPDLSSLIKNMQGEGYQLTSQKDGNTEVISIVNEYHISCKEYRLTFDAETLDPKQIYLRMSDPGYPEDKKKDKVIELNIKGYSQHSNRELDQLKEFVKKRGTSWVAEPGYESYDLVVI